MGAEPLVRQAMALKSQALGEEHPSVASGHDALADVLSGLGRLREARAELERALSLREAALGEDHPSVGTSLVRLATLLRREGRGAAAWPG